MSKKILIVGKNAASIRDFSEAFTLGDFAVAVADDAGKRTTASANVSSVIWNKGSAVAARSLLIQAETAVGSAIDDYILFFDSPLYTGDFTSFTADNCQKSSDEMITAFQYVVMEAITRIEQKNKPGRIIFILKTHPTAKDFILSPAAKNLASIPANPFVAAAEAAFANFAENVAAVESERDYVSVLLISGDSQNETMNNTSAFAKWLAGYIDASDNLKSKPSAKASLNWIKPGAKNPGGFSLFK